MRVSVAGFERLGISSSVVEFRTRGNEVGIFLAAIPAHEPGALSDPARGLDRDLNLLVFDKGQCSHRLQNAVLVDGFDRDGHERAPNRESSSGCTTNRRWSKNGPLIVRDHGRTSSAPRVANGSRRALGGDELSEGLLLNIRAILSKCGS